MPFRPTSEDKSGFLILPPAKSLLGIETCSSMVDILCPHCEEEIELEDDASGEFACPFCDGEFEWNMQPPTPVSYTHLTLPTKA